MNHGTTTTISGYSKNIFVHAHIIHYGHVLHTPLVVQDSACKSRLWNV